MRNAFRFHRLSALILFSLAILSLHVRPALAQISLEQLEARLKSQYAEIEKEIASPPTYVAPDTYRIVIRAWQDRLSSRFGEAANTVDEILKLNPANAAFWQERLETLRLYAQPVSSPDQRRVYGYGEMQKRARVIDSPAAIYTNEARANNVKGEVRLRLVLSADGTVTNILPIKSLSYGLSESAMEAARQIKFQPAIRNGASASQYATFVYEFKKNNAMPYIPRTVF